MELWMPNADDHHMGLASNKGPSPAAENPLVPR